MQEDCPTSMPQDYGRHLPAGATLPSAAVVKANDRGAAATYLEPGRHDVVFGKGRGNQDRPGNVRLRHILAMHVEMYESAG